MPRLLLLLAATIALAALALVAVGDFGLADGLRITAAYLVAYLVPMVILNKSRGCSTAGHAVLLAVLILLVCVSYESLLKWTALDGYSLERPNLLNDSRNYYKWALYRYDGSVEPTHAVFPGFPLMLLALWKVLGLSVIWPQAMNMMFTMTTVVLAGQITRRVLAGRVAAQPTTLVTGGMALMLLLPYFLMSGVGILKEAPTSVAVAMAGYSLSSMVARDEDRHHLWWDLLVLVLACALLTLVRTTFLYTIAVGVVVMTTAHPRRDWAVSLGMLALIALCLVIGNSLAAYSFDRHSEILSGGWNMQRQFNGSSIYKGLIGFYFLYSPWHKLLLLPVTMSIQFLLPLPWANGVEAPLLLSSISRMIYCWYLFGGTALFYYVVMSWRRRESLGVWAWWPALIYAALAYVMAGSMARYLLPFEPLMVPIVMYVLYRLYEGHRRRAYGMWMLSLVVVVGIGLALALELQQETFSTMFHTQSLLKWLIKML